MKLIPLVYLAALPYSLLAADDAIYAPRNSKVEIDNTWVRVLRVKEAPGEKIAAYRHPGTVRVYITPAHLRFRGAGGTIDDVHKSGEVGYVKAGADSEENLTGTPIEVAVIELKPGASRSQPVKLDPVALDPEHHLVAFENDRVRAIHTILLPHLKSPEHEHPHYVVVYMTVLHTTMKLADGRVVDNPRQPGEIAWRDPLKHVTENIADKTAEEIQVEIK